MGASYVDTMYVQRTMQSYKMHVHRVLWTSGYCMFKMSEHVQQRNASIEHHMYATMHACVRNNNRPSVKPTSS